MYEPRNRGPALLWSFRFIRFLTSFYQTICWIDLRFCVGHQATELVQICSNCDAMISNMAAMVASFKRFSSPEPLVKLNWNCVDFIDIIDVHIC